MRSRLTQLTLMLILLNLGNLSAQTVQLPTYRVFRSSGTVSVPDGGAALLSGNTISRSGAHGNGIPILGRVPGLGRGFQNRAFGADNTVNRSWVTAQIIDHREWDAAVLAEARRLRGGAAPPDLATSELERQAALLTQHVGRTDRNQALNGAPGQPASSARYDVTPRRSAEPPIRLGFSQDDHSQSPQR
jgi:type II secretory pathway component GspD/PulD (secretin)